MNEGYFLLRMCGDIDSRSIGVGQRSEEREKADRLRRFECKF